MASQSKDGMHATALIRQSSRHSAGVYELQLRRKLIQQQLGVVDEKCKRMAEVVSKKQSAKLSRKEKLKINTVPGKREGDETGKRGGGGQHSDVNPRGLPAIDVVSACSGGVREYDVTAKRIPRQATKLAGRRAASQQQHFLAPAPFKKGSCIDHTNKKHMLQDKRREIERDAVLERRRRLVSRPVNARDEIPAVPSLFPDRYLRGEVPCSKHCSLASALVWVCPLEQLDYDYYLPMFFEGIRCLEEPAKTLARQGVSDLLSGARGSPQRILPSLQTIMKEMRVAISCKNPELLLFACSTLQELAQGNSEVGEALVGYFRMFLQVFNIFMNTTKSTGDMIDYGQRNSHDIGEAISITIEVLERHGGQHAFAHIKHCIPTYQSCLI